MPSAIRSLLTRAIRARTRFTNSYREQEKSNTSQDLKHRNENHSYFITVLERVQEILGQPAAPATTQTSTKSTSKAPQTESATTAAPASKDTEGSNLNNRFGALRVEDLGSEDELDIVASDKKLYPANINPKGIVWELETDVVSEASFRAFCLFEEFNSLGQFVVDTWDKVLSGEVDRKAAALTSNVAFELAGQIEENFCASYPDLLPGGPTNSYLTIMDMINGTNDKERKPATVQDLYYGEIYMIIMKYVQAAEGLNEESRYHPYVPDFASFFTRPTGRDQEFRHAMADTGRGQRSVFSGEETPAILLTKYPELAVQDQLLSRLMLSLEYFKKEELDQDSPYRDVLTNRLFGAIKCTEDRIPAYSISTLFVSKMWLAINRMMEQLAEDPYQHFCERAGNAFHFLGSYETSRDTDKLKELWKEPYEVFCVQKIVRHTHELSENSERIGRSHRWRRSCKNNPRSNKDCIHASDDLAFFVRQNSIYSYMESLKLDLGMEAIGVDHANTMTSFVMVAHLYNAFVQFGLLGDTRWAALDTAIEQHIGTVFNGEKPITLGAIERRLELKLGKSLITLAPDSRRNQGSRIKHFQKASKIVARCASSEVLGRYIDGTISAEKLMFEIESLRRVDKSKNSSRVFDRISLLSRLRERVSEDMPRIENNLVGITQDCSEYLRRTRSSFEKKFNLTLEKITGDYSEGWPCRSAEQNMIQVLQLKAEFSKVERGQKVQQIDIAVVEMKIMIQEVSLKATFAHRAYYSCPEFSQAWLT